MNARYGRINKRSSLLSQREQNKLLAKSAHDICLALAIAVLSDKFHFEDDEIKSFTDGYNELTDLIGVGREDIKEIRKNIYEVYGVVV